MDAQGTRSLGKDSVIVGFALFAMFFGAGNLIFPPTLGQQSGQLWPWGFIGFLIADAVLSCVGVYAVNAAGGPQHALNRVLGRAGGTILGTAAILCLCVLFAMPRTAATTFELSVAPYLGDSAQGLLAPFSIAFFVVVYLLACRKSRVVDIIGKFFTPTLVICIVVLIVAGIVHPIGPIEAPLSSTVFQEGVRAGYQTMDVLGAAAFSLIILDSAIVSKRPEGPQRLKLLASASICAVAMLAIVYGGLTYLGATSLELGSNLSQAALLVSIVKALLGNVGMVLLSIIVLLACVTTAVALVSSAADFFNELLGNRISYNALLIADCVIGALICDIGLDAIIRFADPVLAIVYPPFITVVVLLMFHRNIKRKRIYQGAAIGAFVAAVVLSLSDAGMLTALPLNWLPFYSMGLGWIVFAVLGGLIGWAVERKRI